MLIRVLRISALALATAAPIAYGAIPATERQVLLNLYASTGGSGWTTRTGWAGAAGTECSWYGVGCDDAGAHVIELNLDSNALSGTLPSIAGLPDLEYCILSNNRLTGSIPPVSALTHLRILELYANQLTGSIPSLAGLSSLTSLELNSNRLTGSIPSLASLTSLQVFDLDTNDLTGLVPSLSAMTALQYMALDTNRLSGQIPPLSALPQLSDCELYDNDFSGPVPSLSGLSMLRILLLSNNALSGPVPDPTGTALETLDLDYNALTGAVPSSIGNAKTLRRLLVAGNALVGALPSSLGNLTNLEAGGSDFRYNGLWSTSASLTSFLDGKQEGGDWQSTQTVAPTGVSAGSPTNNALRFSWTPILYGADAGSYGVYLSKTSGGPYVLAASTGDKTAGTITVADLDPSTTYFAVVRTTTASNPNNANVVTSAASSPVSLATTSCGTCALAAAALLVEGASPFPSRASEPNGILEPGETTLLSPSWTNVSAGTINGISGTLSTFGGPTNGGASYFLPDAAASYGDLSPGATGSCRTNGYQVRVTADTRPAAHWDATVDETLDTGETHTWTLHVGESFSDVPKSDIFYATIETVLHRGITVGCGDGTTFCPADSTSREQMAAFITRAVAGSDAGVPSEEPPGDGSIYDCADSGGRSQFTDVPPASTGFCRYVNYLKFLGITNGCGDGTSFCPSALVTRGQMAVFTATGVEVDLGNTVDPGGAVPRWKQSADLKREYNCTSSAERDPDTGNTIPGGTAPFLDVPATDAPGSICPFVGFLYTMEAVSGDGTGHYLPDSSIVRGETAAIMTGAFSLTLYGP